VKLPKKRYRCQTGKAEISMQLIFSLLGDRHAHPGKRWQYEFEKYLLTIYAGLEHKIYNPSDNKDSVSSQVG
jgi:hypothetical protein